MNPSRLSFTLERRDHKALTAHLCAPVNARAKRLGRWLGPVAVVMAAVVAAQFLESLVSFLLGILFITILLWAFIKFVNAGAQRQLEPAVGGAILCQYQFTLNADGVDMVTPFWSSQTRWGGILAVEETVEHVFFRIDSVAAYTIPKRAFANPEALLQFVTEATARVAQNRHSPPTPAIGPP